MEINTTGIILAGGKSSRMGRDKGLIPFHGKPFVQHIIDTLAPITSRIMIVSDSDDYEVFGQRRVRDLIKHAGPLGGLYTGLHYSNTEDNLVLSCDVPLISATVLNLLISASQDHNADVVQVQSHGRTMPLIALYKKWCEHHFWTLLEAGERRLRVAVDQLKTHTIDVDESLAECTANINTPDHLNDIIHATDR